MSAPDMSSRTEHLLHALIAEVRMLRHDLRVMVGGKPLTDVQQMDYAAHYRIAEGVAEAVGLYVSGVDSSSEARE